MTKKEFNKYHREEKDALDNTVRVGDLVISSPYGVSPRISKIIHFTSGGKCKTEEVYPIRGWNYYPYTVNLIKIDSNLLDYIKDKCNLTSDEIK